MEKIDGKEFETKIQDAEFNKTVITDNVTNEGIDETPYTSKDNNFRGDCPELEGYTSNNIKIGVDGVKPTEKDSVYDIIYEVGKQKGKVTYINDNEANDSKKGHQGRWFEEKE